MASAAGPRAGAEAGHELASLRHEAALPVVMADDEGMITYVNSRFEEAFGWNRSELVGRPLTTIIPRRLHDAHNLGFSRFLLTGVPTLLDRPLALRVACNDGSERTTEHVISAERVNGRWVFGATIRPTDTDEGGPPDA